MKEMFEELFKELPWQFKVLWVFNIIATITIFSLLTAALVKIIQHL